MGLLKECFWTLRGPQRLPWDPKDGHKLLLGKKHTIVEGKKEKRQNSRSGELSIIYRVSKKNFFFISLVFPHFLSFLYYGNLMI